MTVTDWDFVFLDVQLLSLLKGCWNCNKPRDSYGILITTDCVSYLQRLLRLQLAVILSAELHMAHFDCQTESPTFQEYAFHKRQLISVWFEEEEIKAFCKAHVYHGVCSH